MSVRRSLVGSAAAMGLLLGQGASLVHLVVEQHERCPEHGELVDARSTETRAATGDLAGERLAAAAGDHDSHQHEHCLVVANRREEAAQGDCLSVGMMAPGAGGPDPFSPEAPAFSTESIFRIAPKNSPPV